MKKTSLVMLLLACFCLGNIAFATQAENKFTKKRVFKKRRKNRIIVKRKKRKKQKPGYDTLTTWEKLKASPFSFGGAGVVESLRDADTLEMDGAYYELDLFFGIQLSDNDSITLMPIWTYETQVSADEDNYNWFLTELSYTRSNVLNEKDHGVGSSISVGAGHYNDANFREALSRSGYGYGNIRFNKSFGDFFSLGSKFQFKVFARTNSAVRTTVSEARIELTPAFALSDKVTFSTLFRYQHSERVGIPWDDHQKIDFLRVWPRLSYAHNEYWSFSVYAYANPWMSHDQLTIVDQFNEKITIGGDVSFNVF